MLNWIFPKKYWPDGREMTREEESQHWIVRCRSCGYETNIHALGGIRYRARGDGKKPRINCPNCGPRQRTLVEWRPPVG